MALAQGDIDQFIKNQGSAEQTNGSAEASSTDTATIQLPEFQEIETQSDSSYPNLDPKLELLYDLQLPVSIELGRTNMLIRNILRLGRGSVIEFDKLVSEPVDILINGKKVAEGEVVVIDKHFGIRITTLIDPTDRIKSLRR